MKISFYGGAGEITGANYLLESNNSKVLIDCGLFQGQEVCQDRNRQPFLYRPASIDALLVTHAHLDHIGRIPKLIRDGFKGPIFSTRPTKDLAEIMLLDSLGVMEKEARRENREIFYKEEDVYTALKQWQAVDYHQEFAPPARFAGATARRARGGDFRVIFKDAGHILGSAMIEIAPAGHLMSGRTSDALKVVFTGDLGNPPAPLLRPTEEINDADFLIIESTYGDRLHETKAERRLKLERIIEDTVRAGGVLMLPAFSLERTQEILFELNDLVENGRIPRVPVFLDSPLAIMATEIYKKHENYFNKETKHVISSGDEIFKFPGLQMTKTTEESKAINNIPPPKVIIAGSGMSQGGRIIHHERRYLPDEKSSLLLIGYQAAGSLGRRLQDGAKKVNILREEIEVRAKIETITGYSSHPDREGLLDFVKVSRDSLKKVLVVQGEPRAALFLTQRLRDYLGLEALAPRYGETFEVV